MSVAGHNLPGAERHADDFYATPEWVTHLILPFVSLGRFPLDPAAGDGAILDALCTSELADAASPWGLEIDSGRVATCTSSGHLCIERDALSPAPWREVETPTSVITNPPFSLAMDFVQRSLAETDGEVIMLLRLAFLESRGRAAFHRDNPADVFPLSERPSFVEHLKWRLFRCPGMAQGKNPSRCELEAGHLDMCRKLGTDSTAYAWFRWPERGSRGPDYQARIKVLGG